MFGPFHRVETPTQTIADALLQIASKEIWGKIARNGGLDPCVKAYPGAILSTKRGIEFTTAISPEKGYSSPIEIRWYYPNTPDVELRTKDDCEFACVKVATICNMQIEP